MSGIAAEADPSAPDRSVSDAPIDVMIVAETVTAISTGESEREEMPLPDDARTVFLGGLFLLACLAAMYVAQDILLPIVLAIVLKLLLQPVVRGLERVRVPRVLAALAAVLLLIGIFAGLVTALTRPAADWVGKLPMVLPRFEHEMHELGRPLHAFQQAIDELEGAVGGRSAPATTTAPAQPPAPTQGAASDLPAAPARPADPAKAAPAAPSPMALHATALMEMVFSSTQAAIAGFFTALLVLFYLLVSGETFLRRLVEILPRFRDKRLAVEISLKVEHDISVYLVTITMINAIVGIATGCVMWVCGVGDPLLWGVTAFVLNYIPVLGPLTGVVLFAIVGVLSQGAFLAALLPAGLYLLIHLIEGETVTPMILARRFTINPVALILSLVFWYFMWGVAGAVLSVPMLTIIKVVCDDVPPLRAFGHFLEG